MSIITPSEQFNLQDLTLEVNLRSCINGSSYDFTGRRTFNVDFYKNNIGFGITNVSIDISTSLQPVIDITFKDLYGNTLFGTQAQNNSDIDSSVLFNWPPPKFIFSFKGYLGRKVTWMLNLKTTNVSYVPSDGSFEVKCSFVPNQWGFLADIPILYLLACKKLRTELYGGSERRDGDCVFTSDSIFSFTRIGKQVQSKTQTQTKDFDMLSKQLTGLKYTSANSVFSTKIIIPNEPIVGIVNNIPIKGFTNLQVSISNFDSLKKDASDSSNTVKLNNYLYLNTTRGGLGIPSDENAKTPILGSFDYSKFKTNGDVDGFSSAELNKKKEEINQIVDENLKLIDVEIKKRVYASTKKEIGKLTIGEVFSQISRDAAFILGYILDSGFDGYKANKGIRDAEKRLIGKHFPLILKGDEGVEVPAYSSYGIEDYELKCVDKFIEAIGEGIASNLLSDDVAVEEDSKVKNRINNLEALQPNPYRPTFANISENILIRSGIIAFLTRSNDPSIPGDYGKNSKYDRDGLDEILELVKKDMENLSEDILGQLSFEEKAQLVRFCTFFNKLLSDDGEDFLMSTNSDVNEGWLSSRLSFTENTPLNSQIRTYPIAMNDISDEAVKKDLINAFSGGTSTSAGKSVYKTLGVLTLDDILSDFLSKPSAPSGNTEQNGFANGVVDSAMTQSQSYYNSSTVDKSTLTAICVKNNGLYYSLPDTNKNSYYYVLFENTLDVENLSSVNVTEKTDEAEIDDADEPIGFIPINGTKDAEGNSSGRIETLNDIIDRDQGRTLVDYNLCKNYYSDTTEYMHKSTSKIETVDSQNQIPAKNLAFAVYAHSDTPLVFSKCVFAPFSIGKRGINQRASIKLMCRTILDKFNNIETKKNEVLGSVLGKAGEHRESIYKQMHTIFHQWEVIASSIGGGEFCNKYESSDKLSLILEKEYGDCKNHIDKGLSGNNSESLDVVSTNNKAGTTMFVYDYPLAPVNQKEIKVKNSIINIEALYKPNGNTTILNIIQQICTKNNFIFVPFPGDANSDNVNEIYKPNPGFTPDNIKNYFHVLFTPTPETRSKLSNDDVVNNTDYMDEGAEIKNQAIGISFGSIYNQIVKNFNVNTDSTKPTAESILNLQRLVDKENTSKTVSMDCSMLSVYEGRSYKASVEMIGNAQVYPMQYFYIQKMPMFGGLYQIMKVSHSITPNNMTTSLEGIRMRYSAKQGYGGVPPITLEYLDNLGNVEQVMVGRTATGSTGTFISSTIEEIAENVGVVDIIESAMNIIPIKIFDAKGIQVSDTYFRSASYGDFWEKGDFHGGVDIRIGSGTPLLCPFKTARVIRAGVISGYGGAVVLETEIAIGNINKKIKILFGHCREWKVKTGQVVTEGMVVALSGGRKEDPNNGFSTGAHLHFELSIDNKRVEVLFHAKIIGTSNTTRVNAMLLEEKNMPYNPKKQKPPY